MTGIRNTDTINIFLHIVQYRGTTFFFRAVDVENAIKLAAADDGFVTYEELRENLRKARFSDTEIDLFFYHFQNDPIISQIILDEEEVKAKEAVREKRRMSMLSSLSAEEVSEEEEELASGDGEDKTDCSKTVSFRRSIKCHSSIQVFTIIYV